MVGLFFLPGEPTAFSRSVFLGSCHPTRRTSTPLALPERQALEHHNELVDACSFLADLFVDSAMS
jgi:hypothetical protein